VALSSLVTNRTLQFSEAEMVKLREACRILGTSYVEFAHHAIMEAVGEVIGLSIESAQSGPRDGVRIAGQ
jgi:hypothetical protein